MNNEQKSKFVAVIITILLIAALGALSYTIKVGKNTKLSLLSEKLKSESLLSEKLTLEKQIDNFKNDIKGLIGKNEKLDAYLTDLKSQLAQKEKVISKLNNSYSSLQQLKKENAEINVLREDLLSQVATLSKTNDQLNSDLMSLKKKYEELKTENTGLEAKLNERNVNKLIDQSAGNFMIEPLKKNQSKLTLKAQKTNSINISFDVSAGNPQDLSYTMYRMVLQRPEGGDVIGQQKTERKSGNVNLTASNIKAVGGPASDRINISFIPKEKLSPGIYTVVIYEGNYGMGSAKIRLVK